MTCNSHIQIDTNLAQRLICQQFPKWSDLSITAVAASGWDNRTFHLGNDLLIRIPSSAAYASQVEKEQYWLPRLTSHLPLAIPEPVAIGKPTNEYPWHWSVYHWLEGETATTATLDDLSFFAEKLAHFLNALRQCNTTGAPVAGPDNFHRGGPLAIYDVETRRAIAKVSDAAIANEFLGIWERALTSTWQENPVWIHGDIATGNLLINKGELSAVIDFGQLAIGDPACDLALYWTFLSGESRAVFRQMLALDDDTWDRGRGWVLWKTLCAPIAGTNTDEIFNAIIADYQLLLRGER